MELEKLLGLGKNDFIVIGFIIVVVFGWSFLPTLKDKLLGKKPPTDTKKTTL